MVEQEVLVDHNLKVNQVDLVVEMVEMQVMEQEVQEMHLPLVLLKVKMVVDHQEQTPLMVVAVVELVVPVELVLFNKEEMVVME